MSVKTLLNEIPARDDVSVRPMPSVAAGSMDGGQSCGTSRPNSGRPINSSLRTNFLKPSSARTFGILVGRLGVHCDLAHVLSFWCWGEQSVARAHATGGRRKYEWRSELWNKSSYQWAADRLKLSLKLSTPCSKVMPKLLKLVPEYDCQSDSQSCSKVMS